METVKKDAAMADLTKGMPIGTKPGALLPVVQQTFAKLSELILNLSKEIVKSNDNISVVERKHEKSINLLEETLKNFGSRLDAMQEKIDMIHSANSITSACGPVVVNVESVEELENKIKKLAVGDYRIHFKELSGIHLYVGDDHALLFYPDFYEFNIPSYTYNHMSCSVYSWVETLNGTKFNWKG